jgi:hypothetical protein
VGPALVWRPKKARHDASVHRCQPASALAAAAGAVPLTVSAELGQEPARRCHWPRKRKASSRGQRDLPGEPNLTADNDQASLTPSSVPLASLPCILDWSSKMMRAEEDLNSVVVVTVISDWTAVVSQEIAELTVPHLDVEASSLVLHQVSSSSFL